MERLASYIWVDALIRRVQLGGASAFVTHKGDHDRGDVLIKLARLDGKACLFTHSPLSFEETIFDRLPGPYEWADEREIDELVAKRVRYDEDLWVIEIEDREGRHFLTEKVNGEHDAPDSGPKA